MHMLPFQWNRRSVFIQLQFPENLVGTRVEPVVYVHNHHLQLRVDAAIPVMIPFPFFTSFKSEQTQKYVNSSIYNLSLNTLYQKKNSATVLKQRKELLRRLYPRNELKNILHVGFQTDYSNLFNIYSRVEGYSFSSQTCLLFQRKIIFDIIWFPFIVTVRTQTKYKFWRLVF